MADHSRLLEKEGTAFAAEKSAISTSRSCLSQTIAPPKKQPEVDKLLEKTLLDIKLEAPLTKREVEILGLIVAGNTNKKIAHKINRTERTVEYHRHRLMRKLGTKTAVDLVKRAIAMGII